MHYSSKIANTALHVQAVLYVIDIAVGAEHVSIGRKHHMFACLLISRACQAYVACGVMLKADASSLYDHASCNPALQHTSRFCSDAAFGLGCNCW